jgi:hypothetical protein
MAFKVTPAMSKAGSQMASDLMDASIRKSLGGDGLGGCKAYKVKDFRKSNRKIIEKYLRGKIQSVDGIYLAMRKASKKEKT